MTTFNTTLTIEEATAIFKFKGSTMFPDTDHNRKMMLQVVTNHLKSLKNASN